MMLTLKTLDGVRGSSSSFLMTLAVRRHEQNWTAISHRSRCDTRWL